MKSAAKPGQVLILVLLVVVVSLAVGLSVASRNITNIRTSTQTEESQKAFSAAEGGIEYILSQDLGKLQAGDQPPVDVGNLQANVKVETSTTFENPVGPGSVAQIDVSTLVEGQKVKIHWAKAGETPASVEITQVSGQASNTQERKAYAGGTGGGNESGFEVPANPGGCASGTFQKCVIVTLQAYPKLLRIRPLWAISTFRVHGVDFDLPTQNYKLTSTASTPDGITRTVQVTKTLPQLPAVFDYAIYSDNPIVK